MDPVGPDDLKAIPSCAAIFLCDSFFILSSSYVWTLWDLMLSEGFLPDEFPVISLSMRSSSSVWTLWDLMLSERCLPMRRSPCVVSFMFPSSSVWTLWDLMLSERFLPVRRYSHVVTFYGLVYFGMDLVGPDALRVIPSCAAIFLCGFFLYSWIIMYRPCGT